MALRRMQEAAGLLAVGLEVEDPRNRLFDRRQIQNIEGDAVPGVEGPAQGEDGLAVHQRLEADGGADRDDPA
jgi:hypothetical protein